MEVDHYIKSLPRIIQVTKEYQESDMDCSLWKSNRTELFKRFGV
jgi:hypothetical protein